MSEPKLVSPLLDGFVMGDPISSHHGVRCCPAMQTASEKKYIVKIISVPASQSKLDALLLAGAFSSTDSALTYFRDLADGIVDEAVLLQRLSRLEGFTPFENWQLVPMEDGEVGFDIYLTGTYRPNLERLFRKETMTHLGAVNLGLDLCAALAVCRRSGYLYADLKPENIFICQDHEYRIGDIGFIPLESLEYASLPERCLSAYTAPEITDAYSSLNTTLDVYAAGLVLYQAYNGGVLPFEGRAPAEPLSAPQYADSEMAQIILKACDPNPEVRWQDPLQMGQALVTYLQSHSVNDTPIIVPPTPVMPEILDEEPEALAGDEPSTDEIIAEVDEALVAVGVSTDVQIEEDVTETNEDTSEVLDEVSAEETEADVSQSDAEVIEEVSEEAAEGTVGETAEEVIEVTDESGEENEDISTEEEVIDTADEITEESVAEVVSETVPAEETTISAEAAALQRELGVSEEVSQILAQADELIAHETPDPVVAPEPIDVPVPVITVDTDTAEETAQDKEDSEENSEEPDTKSVETTQAEEFQPDEDEDDEDDVPPAKAKKSHGGWIAFLIVIALLAGLAFGAYYYYENYYLQTIMGISLSGEEDRLTVSLNTKIEDSLLTVYCTDTYGNTTHASVSGGKAHFSDLNPATSYKISVEISGFHKLIGTTTDVHVTAEQTSIVNFGAVTGAEDGSVILNFTVQGPETNKWKVTYTAEGEEKKSISFTGHMVTVTDLTVGKEYTFLLEPETPLYIIGTDTVKYTASKIIYAEDLTIHGFKSNALITSWKAPAGVTVESWIVRCYNDKGYDKTFTTEETKASFTELDISTAYTVEVHAVGMTQGTRAYVSANSVTVDEIVFDDSNRNQLSISWDFEGTTPEGGWLLLYTVDDSKEQLVVKCDSNSGIITPLVPGCKYSVTVQPANGNTVFGGSDIYKAADAQSFAGYLLTAADMYFQICKTPDNPQWGRYDIPAENYTSTFAVGDSASFAVFLNHEYNTSSDIIVTLFVIRDANGQIVSTATQSRTWTSMWYRGFGRITVPALPEVAGNYTLDIYFNGAIVTTQSFTIA